MSESTTIDEHLIVLSREERQYVQQLLSSKQMTAWQNMTKMIDLLIRLPYPLLQLLQADPNSSNILAGKLIRAALERLLSQWYNTDASEDGNGKGIPTAATSTTIEPDNLHLINFIANLPLIVFESASLPADIMSTLPRITMESDEVCMALLCRSDKSLLDQVLNEMLKSDSITISKEYVLQQAVQHKQHFVPLFCEQLKDPIGDIADVAVRNNLLVLKLANEFSSATGNIINLENVMHWLNAFHPDESPEDLKEVHRFFHADFQRLNSILVFLQKYPEQYKQISIRALINANSVLQLIYQFNIVASYEETSRVVETTHKWQQHMILNAKGVSHNLELETLTYYAALCTVLNVLLPVIEMDGSTMKNDDQYYTNKMQQLHGLLRQIRNLDALCALIEDIFQLIFLRWEHVNDATCVAGSGGGGGGERSGVAGRVSVPTDINTSRSKSTRSSESSEPALSETPPNTVGNGKGGKTAVTPQHSVLRVRHGFICRGQALHCIFTQLRNFVTRKCHSEDYKHASERIRLRFQRIIDVISEALWKYSVLEKIDDALSRSGGGFIHRQQPGGLEQQEHQQKHFLAIGSEELVRLVRMHSEMTAKSSTDDDNGCDDSRAGRDRSSKLNSLTRRRRIVKVRRRATFSGPVRSPDNKEALRINASGSKSFIISSGGDRNMNLPERHKIHDFVVRFADRSIIPKMLGSPEKLAIMALALNNLDDVKYIIETFNLHNSELNRELSFVEQQQAVKQKLATIYANYCEQEDSGHGNGEKPKATVDVIKQAAAKGFEVSKIINVIDNFAKSQQVQQSPEMRALLQKHSANPLYASTLRQFEERNLNATLICDLILNLPFNREITADILAVIKRQQQMASGVVVGNHPPHLADHEAALQAARLPRDIGSMQLLENMCECLRLLPQTTLHQLLWDNYYTLRPRQLAIEQQREQAFSAVFYRTDAEIGRCSDLKNIASLFHNLKTDNNYFTRFSVYVINLARLLHLRDRNLEYHIGELLKIDPYTVIGELVFEHHMLLEIAANVSALNLNLVHVIALNMCPHIIISNSSRNVAENNAHKMISKCTQAKLETILNYVGHQNGLLAWILQCILENNYLVKEKRKSLLPLLPSSPPPTTPTTTTTTSSFGNPQATNVDRLRGGIQAVFMERLILLPELEQWANLFGGNRFIAALRSDDVSVDVIRRYLSGPDQRMEQLAILVLELGNRGGYEAETREIDRLITELIELDPKNVHLAAHVRDIALRARLIYENFTRIATTRLAKELIENTLQHRQAVLRIPNTLRQQLEDTLADITIYAQVSAVLQFETWPQAYDFGQKTPSAIFQRLLQLRLFELCYEWCGVVKLVERFSAQKRLFLEHISVALLQLTDEEDDTNADANQVQKDADQQQVDEPEDGNCHNNSTTENVYLLKILHLFSTADCVSLLDTLKDRFRSIALLDHVIQYLSAQENANKSANGDVVGKYQNYRITLVIMRQLMRGERASFWQLLRHPLLIVEQLIMNAKFELLTKVLQAVRAALDSNNDCRDVGICSFCFNKHGNIYNIHMKPAATTTTAASAASTSSGRDSSPTAIAKQQRTKFQIGATDQTSRSAISAFMLLNFNLYQADHVITHECIDLLLRIYATKALDYHIADGQSSWEQISQSTDTHQSLDSLWEGFQMPQIAPTRDDWVRDEDATHCMCCRRAKFTMLMRRHHCRRCGRVVCFACSVHRMRIPEYYAEVEVRICNDCHRNTVGSGSGGDGDGVGSLEAADKFTSERLRRRGRSASTPRDFKWQLSGNITHDKLVREEFCYDHAPSVGLCLSILGSHRSQSKCIDLLLYHCRQLEKLLVPNPEVDYELVAKMMNCLAVAAKVRGGPDEIETIRVHSEIIIAVVQYGCEALIPPGPLNNHSLRKLADALVQAEKWPLALEVHLKCGFPTTGVMAAHGLSCLRAGCYSTAREKLSHCMTRVSSELINAQVLKTIMSPIDEVRGTTEDIPIVKRPHRAQPLLHEILRLIEATPLVRNTQPEMMQRTSVIRQSHTSLVSLLSRSRKEAHFRPLHEPSQNIVATLANLKRIARGHYSEMGGAMVAIITPEPLDNRRQLAASQTTRGFDECMHYVLSYGSHGDILQFLIHHDQMAAALRYTIIQHLETEHFVQHIYMVALRSGRVPQLIERMLPQLQVWRLYLLATCRHLETHRLLHSLYQLQLLLKDPVRASMTCVRFYSMRCDNFQQLHANAEHLHNAQLHLQSELEMAQWENINMDGDNAQTPTPIRRRGSIQKTGRRPSAGGGGDSVANSFVLQMDARALNSHINTIVLQLEVAKFLANCEAEHTSEGASSVRNTIAIWRQIRFDSTRYALPTLFDDAQEKIQLCILLLLCGKNIEQGFGLAYRVIEAYKLSTVKVFGSTTKYLARNRRLPEVEKLLNCIRSNGDASVRTSDIDDLLAIAINSATNNHEPEVKATLDVLVKRIHSVDQRITSHMFIGQLKSAYLLANKHNRMGAIRKILRQAESSNQIHIKKLCEKKLSIMMSEVNSRNGGSGSQLRTNTNPMGTMTTSAPLLPSQSSSSSSHSVDFGATGRGSQR